MINISDMKLGFGERILFKDVNLKFVPGNCYGIIGANGAGKSTFLKLLSGEMESDSGQISYPPNLRMAVLRQDHFEFDNERLVDVVIRGYDKLFNIMKEREMIYAKEDFSEADGLKASELEGEFAELGGWEAEAEASQLLSGLGVPEDEHEKLMAIVSESSKVRALLAQALFGNPDILLLDEPTNGLDLESIAWLEDFLIEFPNIVIVVSHDRHFLNAVCTQICDIDFGLIRQYPGNYDFWYKISRMLQTQMKDEKRRREDKIRDLKEFIQRFASNAAKSRQATSRRKVLEKLEVEELQPTSRRFPWVAFKPLREPGNNIISINGLGKNENGKKLFGNLDILVNKGDKIAFVGKDHLAKTALFRILAGEDKDYEGAFSWGQTITVSSFPKDNAHLFESDESIVDWLKRYTSSDDETYIRSFLGRMLFSGDEALKPVKVLSGGEKVRCLLSRLMIEESNCLILDEPTNHLDLEAITALNNGLIEFPGILLFTSHDHEFVESIANRIIEFCPGGIIDRMMNFDNYLKDPQVRELRNKYYGGQEKFQI
ncbi:ABC-F family ATP-binding cassette domain-containing protein [Spirochaetota bacterium]